ncbi:hypothetical protein HK102_010164, partial [Quaeritorhiza haematococci]
MKRGRKKRKACLTIYRSTIYEQRIARLLGDVPMHACRPEHQWWGTKAGSRSVFRAVGIPHPDGTYGTSRYGSCDVEGGEGMDLEEFADEIVEVLIRNPPSKRRDGRGRRGMVKLNDCFAGKGNAAIDLSEVDRLITSSQSESSSSPPPTQETLRTAVLAALETRLTYFCPTESWPTFSTAMRTMGAIFELYIDEVEGQTSPSVQCVIDDEGETSVLSTHEQVLEGQHYVGCEFPARDEYRKRIMEYGKRVGDFLASQGVIDHFSVDFMCTPPADPDSEGGEWQIDAIEINLRLTGTTHPMMTMKLITEGELDTETGLFFTKPSPAVDCDPTPRPLTSPRQPKYLVAFDTIQSPLFHNLTPPDLIEILSRPRPSGLPLHYNRSTQTGVILHMLGSVAEFGAVGATCIGNSREEAWSICGDLRGVLEGAVEE